MSERYRDPIHGFIEVRPLENKIINSAPFQRLRYIRQLAMTYFVYHGAEHTRFGHSLGVMNLVSKAFNAAVNNSSLEFSDAKRDWYEQILRLIALTHDLGHAPFSHASEAVFPNKMQHEDFTEKIINETCIADYINDIGSAYRKKYGDNYDITPKIICDIYSGRKPGEQSEFTFLKSFMDSEIDCDKMDYLLRDSYYCGVNYGKYDIDRLIGCLTIYNYHNSPRLAIKKGGVQAFEEFVLARYFMFVQVYFHRTRRYFDLILPKALSSILPGGTYPMGTNDYILWDDNKVIELIKENCRHIPECLSIISRSVYPRIFNTKTHPNTSDKREFDTIRKHLIAKLGRENIIVDESAGKMPHKIPIRTEIDDEKAIVICDDRLSRFSTISEESDIIRILTEKIDIRRIYVKPEKFEEAKEVMSEFFDPQSEEDETDGTAEVC